jgi:lysozyme
VVSSALNGLSNANRIYAGMWLCVQSAPTSPPAQSPLSAGCAQWYQVRWGDQLRFIAPRYGTTWQALAQLNGLGNANRIYAGTWLCVRAGVITPPASGSRYVVQPGDNLTRLSTRFGVSLASLMAANHIRNPHYIFSGQVLVIPPR